MRGAWEFWDQEVAAPKLVGWMEDQKVSKYINQCITGTDYLGPLDWLQANTHRPLRRCLSIGCGGGGLERELIRRNYCEHLDAFDGSITSLALARQLANQEGLANRIHYYAADFNQIVLPPERYDAVLVHQALHHVTQLERLYAEILRTLKPDGFFYFDEYVGPSRTDWNNAMIIPYQEVINALPLKARLQDPFLAPILADDPSEGVRSSEVVPVLEEGFRVLERRDYGGHLLAPLFPVINWSEAPEGLIERLIEQEKTAEWSGYRTFYAVGIAVPTKDRSASRRRYLRAGRRRTVIRFCERIWRSASHFGLRVPRAIKRRVVRYVHR